MKLELTVHNLSCAHCAQKIETALKDLPEVETCHLNFYSKKLFITSTENLNKDSLAKKINLIAGKIEHGVTFNLESLNENKNLDSKENFYFHDKLEGFTLIAVSIVLAVSFLFQNNLYKTIVLIILYLIIGYDILWKSVVNLKNKNFLDENFLMSIATIGAISIGEYTEAIGVMIFYKIGEHFQEKAVENSKKSIESLLKLKNINANLKTKSGDMKVVKPETLKKDDIIIVKVGESIPVDGIVVKGNSNLNTSTLTGESLPLFVEERSEVLSGSVNLGKVLEIRVLREYKNSAINKIIKMVEESNVNKADVEKFITKFARYYTPMVVVSAIIIGIFPPLFFGNFQIWFKKSLIFLVISCPCALVLSIPLTFFSSIGLASKRGILIKGANFLERLTNIDSVVFDKTGTLTKGIFMVNKVINFNSSEKEIIELAKAGELYSNHPLAKAILKYKNIKIDESEIKNHEEISGKGTSCIYKNNSILVGNIKLMEHFKIDCHLSKLKETNSVIYIAKNNALIGAILLSDEIKKDSKETIEFLDTLNISSYLLTGDNKETGEMIGRQIGFKKENIFTNLLPENKVSILNNIKNKSVGTIFIGDGINDAPSLNVSDIGIAMGGIGSDLAIESANIVLINDEPSKLIELLKIVKINKKVVKENIVFSIGIKLAVMLLSLFGFANIWMAIFADVGVSLIAVLNASKILTIKKL
ncbi:heavy metal translocating P-type ATPase [Fusobacterium sp. IOR10]|uniref:heavy metal translocating P-type ATPase n=1 Tax=Fusobacterium sp. IOR10 TaxID=2665157 RepID=UPI001EF0F686|nr:heavy metal translocating P-type ATPase [Fusobacterium sp. IOR10]